MTTFRAAPAVERIGKELIAKHHDHLADVRIEYVFRDKASKSAGREVWGKARKISGLNAYLATPEDERSFLDHRRVGAWEHADDDGIDNLMFRDYVADNYDLAVEMGIVNSD